MKSLRTATLAVIFMKCITASIGIENNIYEAIDNNEFETVKELCKHDATLWEKVVDYVVDTKDPNFIANFIKQTDFVTGYAFMALCRKPKVIMRKVQDRVGRSEDECYNRAARSNPMLLPDKFIVLLNKIPTAEGQGLAFEMGIEWLFIENRTDCIYPLC